MLLLLVAAGVATLGAGSAHAHVVADLEIASPQEGETVDGPLRISVVAQQTAGTASADFSLTLDGQPVDRNGKVDAGAAFTRMTVAAQTPLTITVPAVSGGVHELRVRYAPDVDSSKPDLVRKFTVRGASSRSPGRGRSVAVGTVFVLLLAASITLRRRGLRQR